MNGFMQFHLSGCQMSMLRIEFDKKSFSRAHLSSASQENVYLSYQQIVLN